MIYFLLNKNRDAKQEWAGIKTLTQWINNRKWDNFVLIIENQNQNWKMKNMPCYKEGFRGSLPRLSWIDWSGCGLSIEEINIICTFIKSYYLTKSEIMLAWKAVMNWVLKAFASAFIPYMLTCFYITTSIGGGGREEGEVYMNSLLRLLCWYC